jgi:levanase/fructan beta-fructosidase
MIAWMNNWEYANHIPTSPWRSPMTLVREVSLQRVDGNWRLIQQAAGELAPHAGQTPSCSLAAIEMSEGQHVLDSAAGSVQRIELTLTPGTAAECGLIVRGDRAQGTRIGIRPAEGSLIVDRRESGQTDFHESFASLDTAPIQATDGSYELTIYVDHCSVEVFAQRGQITMTELIFPAATSTEVSLYAIGGTATLNSLSVTQYA